MRRDPTKVLPVRGWSPTTIRGILRRELYRGVIVWNRSRKRNAHGQVKQRPRPESEWMRIPAEHLRIVSDDVWMRAATRRRETEGRQLRFADGRMTGRPPKQVTQNLLAGLATCAVCGGGFCVETSPRKRGRVPEYTCSRRRVNGTCSNALRLPVSEVNEAVLHAIEEHALTPEAVEAVIHLTERDDQQERQIAIQRELASIGKSITRYVAVLEQASDVGAIADKLRALQARQRQLQVDAAALRPVPRPPRLVVENRLAEWRRLLRQSTEQGRAVLQRVLRGRIIFTPNGAGYDFVAPTRFDKLFTGIAVPAQPRPDWMPEVTNNALGPDDTLDGDYGRLLERATENYVKGVASPTRHDRLYFEGPVAA